MKWKTSVIWVLPVLFAVCTYVNTHYKGFPKVGPPPAVLALSMIYGCVWSAAIFLLRDSRGWLRFFAWYQGLALLMYPLGFATGSMVPVLLLYVLMMPYCGVMELAHGHFFLPALLTVQEILCLCLLARQKGQGNTKP